jgi:hypothetical protein
VHFGSAGSARDRNSRRDRTSGTGISRQRSATLSSGQQHRVVRMGSKNLYFSKSSVARGFRSEDSKERLGQIPWNCLWDFGPICGAISIGWRDTPLLFSVGPGLNRVRRRVAGRSANSGERGRLAGHPSGVRSFCEAPKKKRAGRPRSGTLVPRSRKRTAKRT